MTFCHTQTNVYRIATETCSTENIHAMLLCRGRQRVFQVLLVRTVQTRKTYSKITWMLALFRVLISENDRDKIILKGIMWIFTSILQTPIPLTILQETKSAVWSLGSTQVPIFAHAISCYLLQCNMFVH